MSAFLYGVALQWKLDLRSKTLLITCYLVPLLFFALMGGIFTSVMPEMKETLIYTMVTMGVSMGAFIGMPATLLETCGSDIKKLYRANGMPLGLSLITMLLSSFVHLVILSLILLLAAPAVFGAALPGNLPLFFAALALYTAASLSIGAVLGLAVTNQAKLTMIAQLVFLPSLMLSGIMFPAGFLPRPLAMLGNLFPATWGYRLMGEFRFKNLWGLVVILAVGGILCILLLKRKKE